MASTLTGWDGDTLKFPGFLGILAHAQTVCTSLAGQMFEEGRERLVTVVDFPCARGISLTPLLTCCHETNVR